MPKKSPARQAPKFVRDNRTTVAAPLGVVRVTYSRAEAGEALGCDIQTIDNLIAAGTLPASRPKPGRRVFIRVADVDAMLTASAVRAA